MPTKEGVHEIMIALTIDQEFRSLISPLTDKERARLAASLSEEGCRDPLVVWHGEPPADAAHRCPGPWRRQLALKSMRTEVTWLWPSSLYDLSSQNHSL
jgi:hypothetical protein